MTAKPPRQSWPPERDAVLRRLHPDRTNTEVAELMDSTPKSVATRASALHLYKSKAFIRAATSQRTRARSPWNAELEELMALLYPHAMPGEMEALLGMRRMTVLSKAQNMGIKKTKALLSQIATVRQARLRAKSEIAYRQARWQPGNIPWNTGTKGLHTGGGATRYAKGNQPHTLKPVGTVRLRTVSGVPGVLMEKVAQPDQWRPVHRLVWEHTHGRPIPPGHLVTFKDGNRANLNPDNLQLLSQKEWALKVSPLCNEDLPPDLRYVLRLRGALTRAVNSAQKRNGNQNAAAQDQTTPENPKP